VGRVLLAGLAVTILFGTVLCTRTSYAPQETVGKLARARKRWTDDQGMYSLSDGQQGRGNVFMVMTESDNFYVSSTYRRLCGLDVYKCAIHEVSLNS
jgi:hypothetical protein